MDRLAEVYGDLLANPRPDADFEMADVHTLQKGLQIMEGMLGLVDASKVSSLERAIEAIGRIFPLAAKVRAFARCSAGRCR